MGRVIDAGRRFRTAQIATLVGRARGGATCPVPSQFGEGIATLLGAQGVRAAAWLTWRHRRRLRSAGEMTFHIHPGAKLPGWFTRAIAALENRPGWSVVAVRSEDGKKNARWTVRWERWGRWSRGAV